MSDVGGNIGSAVQSNARSMGPFDGKLFIFHPTSALPEYEQFYLLDGDGFYDPSTTYGVWRFLRMVTDFVWNKNEGDRTVRKERWKGKNVPLEGFYDERMPTVDFTLGEQFDPYSMQVAYADDNLPFETAASTDTDVFGMTLAGGKVYPLPIEFNLVTTIANTITNVALAEVAGGAVPDATYFYCVTAVYGTAETPYIVTAEDTHVLATGPKSLVCTWDAATSQPDKYRVYRTTVGAGGYVTPALVGEVPGYMTQFVDTLAVETAGAPALTATALSVTDITGVINYVDGTDFTFDPVNGTIARISTGAITSGQTILVTPIWNQEYGVKFTLDEGRYKSYHLPLMLIGQQSGTRGKTGMIRIILDSVDWASGADSWTPGTAFDDAGMPFSLPADRNPNTARFGEMGVWDEHIQGFTQISMT